MLGKEETMSQLVKDVMTPDPVVLSLQETVSQAAQLMRNEEIGDVIVVDDQRVRGMVTDRDIVIRGLANGAGPNTPIGEIATADAVVVSADDDAAEAVDLMREHSIRRLPVMNADHELVGVISLGDLAMERDPDSVLADISADTPNS